MALVPAAIFLFMEGSLRLAGYGYATDFFLDGSKIEGSEVWIDNQGFDRWFFPPALQGTATPIPFAIPKQKPAGTYRIFVLGESAAAGFPNPAFSFARVLEVMLRARHPDIRFEVVNTAMVAINSHVALAIARQCARQQPDLFIVHLGNNEVVGPFGAAGVLGPFSPNLGFIRANLAIKTTRTGLLLNRLVHGLGTVRGSSEAWNGMATFARNQVPAGDDRLQRIFSHFRTNLHDICAAGRDAGIPVIICTIPVNLRDSAPFRSQHAPTLAEEQIEAWNRTYRLGIQRENEGKYAEAIGQYQTAAQIDNGFADLTYRLGRCYLALGQTGKARQHFVRARDLDTLRFRSDSSINATIRGVASARAEAGVHLADAERAFDQGSKDGIPGEELFLEHVHMTFEGNYRLAHTLFESIEVVAPPALRGRSAKATPLSAKECAERLGYTDWNELRSVTTIYGMLTTLSPFTLQLDHLPRGRRWWKKVEALQARLVADGYGKAVAKYEKAARGAEGDWMIPMDYGQLLIDRATLFRMPVEPAEEQYVRSLSNLRHNFTVHCKLGDLYRKTGRQEEAISQYQEALRLSPENLEAHSGMAESLLARGKNDQARAVYDARARQGANRVGALLALAGFLSRTGKLEECEARLVEALRLAPDSVGTLVKLADVQRKLEKVEDAIGHYEAALRIWPDQPELLKKVAELRAKRRPA
jgi:tetratricopeptide (TPR) repeat protein